MANVEDAVRELVEDVLSTRGFTSDEVETIKEYAGEVINDCDDIVKREELREAVQDELNKHDFEDLITEALKEVDISEMVLEEVKNTSFVDEIGEAVNDYDFSDEVEKAVEDHDFSHDIEVAIERYDIHSVMKDLVSDGTFDKQIEKLFRKFTDIAESQDEVIAALRKQVEQLEDAKCNQFTHFTGLYNELKEEKQKSYWQRFTDWLDSND
jgi:uncharacterized protein YgfB (UPF0149 family)